ncbi:MAG: GntR family transcriptional regulator [Candidatus Methylacidiphilales bacterium]
MLPFEVKFKPGKPAFEQLAFAVERALWMGELVPGQLFPSVRQLSQELRLNPNTVHRAVQMLSERGFLEVRPGQQSLVRWPEAPLPNFGLGLLREPMDRLVVEARRLGLALGEVEGLLRERWAELEGVKG